MKGIYKPILLMVMVAVVVGLSYVVSAPSPEERFGVMFNIYPDITDVTLDITVQNYQDSSDILDIKTILNETNFDISLSTTADFYLWMPVIIEHTLNNKTCSPYQVLDGYENVTDELYSYYSNCTTLSYKLNITTDEWVSKQLTSRTEDGLKGEVKHRWENIPIQKAGQKKDVRKFRLVFDVPVVDSGSAWGSSGTVYLDMNGKTYVDKTSSSWWDANWDYRYEINLTNVNTTTALNFTPEILLNSSFDFSSCSFDGGDDLRVLNTSSNEVYNHVLESFNKTNSKGLVIPRIPQFVGSGTETIYLYCGNSGASDTASYTATFPHAVAYFNYDQGSGSPATNHITANTDANLSTVTYSTLTQNSIGFSTNYSDDDNWTTAGNINNIYDLLNWTVEVKVYAVKWKPAAKSEGIIVLKMGDASSEFQFEFKSGGVVDSEWFAVRVSTGGGGGYVTAQSVAGTVDANVWYDLASTRDGTNLIIFKDGLEVKRAGQTGVMDQGHCELLTGSAICDPGDSAADYDFDGYIDRFIVSDHILTILPDPTIVWGAREASGIPTINSVNLSAVNVTGGDIRLLVNATTDGTLGGCMFNSTAGTVTGDWCEIDIADNLTQNGELWVNDTFNKTAVYIVNFSITAGSLVEESSQNLTNQIVSRTTTIYNYANDTLHFNINHSNPIGGTIDTNGTFIGNLSANMDTTLKSNWTGDWLSSTETVTDSINNATYVGATYNGTIAFNISSNSSVSFTSISMDFSGNMYNFTNTSSANLSKDVTALLSILETINVTSTPVAILTATVCTSVNVEGITRYTCTSTLNITTDVNDNQIFYDIGTSSLTNWIDRLAGSISGNRDTSTTDLTILYTASSFNMTIGVGHTTSSLRNGVYNINVIYDVPEIGGAGPPPGGDGGGGTGAVTARCGTYSLQPSKGFVGIGLPETKIPDFMLTITNFNFTQRFRVAFSEEVEDYCTVKPILSEEIPKGGVQVFTISCTAPEGQVNGNVIISTTIAGCDEAIPMTLGNTGDIIAQMNNIMYLLISGDIGGALLSWFIFMPVWLWFIVVPVGLFVLIKVW